MANPNQELGTDLDLVEPITKLPDELKRLLDTMTKKSAQKLHRLILESLATEGLSPSSDMTECSSE
ncbi:hypothetical protein ACSYAD_35615 [Acaryochloris marina NIES-2412]|uniref:hypothetical protein n=1 Tax=Acaryochloris marina TaxID=155978 RepID=UPI0040588DA2